jgi:hypothetical protein
VFAGSPRSNPCYLGCLQSAYSISPLWEPSTRKPASLQFRPDRRCLKVLKEVEGPTEPLRELLEGLKPWETLRYCRDDIVEAQEEVIALENFFETEDDSLRGFTRDLNYIQAVLVELEERAVEEKEGKLRERYAFFFDDENPARQEM